MDHIGKLLPKVIGKRGLTKQVHASLVVYKAQQWLEENLKLLMSDLRVHQLKDGVLIICAAHSIAAQECQQCSDELQAYLKSECPETRITQIRLIRREVSGPDLEQN